MTRYKTLRKFYPLLGVFLMLCMCTSGYNTNQSDWYDQDPQANEEDIFDTLFGGDTQADTQSATTDTPAPVFDETPAVTSPAVEPEPANIDTTASTTPVAPATRTPVPMETQQPTIMGHIPEFRSDMIREI